MKSTGSGGCPVFDSTSHLCRASCRIGTAGAMIHRQIQPLALRSSIAGTLLALALPATAQPVPAVPAASDGPAASGAPVASSELPPASTEPQPASSDVPQERRASSSRVHRILGATAHEEEEAAVEEQTTPEEALQSGAGLVNRAHAALRALEGIRQGARVSPELDRLHDEILEQRDVLRERVRQATTNVHRSRRPSVIRDT